MGKIQKEGVGQIQTEGVGKIHKKGVGEIQKEGMGEIQKEGEGSGMGKGIQGKGKGLSEAGMGAAPKCHAQKDPHKKVVPRSPGVHIKTKILLKNNHRAEGMAECINKRDAASTNIGRYYKCKECTFECGTRAACIAHAHRKHTDELIGPCDYCGSFYAHSAHMMKHHVNECAGETTSSYDTND